MAKEGKIEMEGVVTEVLPDRNYRVKLDNGHEVLAYAAGKMAKFKIKVLEGDPDHRDSVLTQQEKDAGGTMMVCCSGSKSGVLVLDL